ncbi:hypothetical protein EWH99_05405 [Sporolactobacillus sp. THM7-7]|nr:hypothetical protein EWH99_05405 [Sporolactobacillus sp. THM7-7]
MSASYSKAEILAKAKAIADRLSETDQVRFYKQAEAKISSNQKVRRLVEDIKKHQKESVNLQHFRKHEAYRENEAKIDRLQAELDAIPVVQEFKQSQEDVNDFLQLIVKLMSQRVTNAMDDRPSHFE